MNGFLWLLLAIFALVLILWLAFIVQFVFVYARAVRAGLMVTPFTLIAQRLRKLDSRRLVAVCIRLKDEGIAVQMSSLERHASSGGSIDRLASGLIRAHSAGLPLSFEEAATLELEGRILPDGSLDLA